MPAAASSARRRLTWAAFLLAAGAGFYLESTYREMFVSKLLIFGSLGLWAWELPRPWRLLQLGAVALLCGAVLYNKYHYRHQHLVPVGPGVYRVANQ